MDLSIVHILLTVIAGVTVLNGLILLFGVGYIIFELTNIWEAEMVLLSMLCDDNDDET